MDESGCGRCHEPGGCGGIILGRFLCSVPRSFRVLNTGNSAIGTRVTVVVAAGSIRRGALLVYGLPLLALLAGAIGGSILAGELGAMIGAACGLFCAWLLLRYAQRRGRPDRRAQPHIRY
jgi:sigma-E factor negative regulatory protein RseC